MNNASARIGEVRILKELIQQLASDLLQAEAVCRYLRGEVERLERENAILDCTCRLIDNELRRMEVTYE